MKTNRRKFLKAAGGIALAAAAGCDQVPEYLVPDFLPPQTEKGPFEVSNSDGVDLITHTLNRLSFGAAPGDYQRVKRMGASPEEAVASYLEEQLRPEKIEDRAAQFAVRRFETLTQPQGELFEYQPDLLHQELSRATIVRAATTQRQLYEVMVQFWSDHFNIDPSKGDAKWLKVADDREVIRKHALGKFPDLLRASALSPAMLWYLDGRVNRKAQGEDKANENYARELMELHTLGVHGGYTQRDVMEVARCLTGWTVRSDELMRKGEIEFDPGRHDDGPKEVLGRQIPAGLGKDDLDRVLSIVSLHPSTGKHIGEKLCKKFVSENPSPDTVRTAADVFLKTEGDIPETLRALFATQEFLNTRGTKFKRPFNYVVSALRATNASTDAGRPLQDYLKRMGHAPFEYPT
ncbi:DUF1800 domain-containing protein, partial [Candidatus Sumerlaeota bacterium]|nr:DUF1800 domain-containing protein [Candidatus Sumerlaeota bacterium]